MADAGPGRRPSALCCRRATPAPCDCPESCRSGASRTPTSPPPPRLNPGGPRGDLIQGEAEAQDDSSGVADQFVAE